MFFNSIKEINRLRKEINRLLSNIMSNIYLKLLLRRSQNFDFLGLKNLSLLQLQSEVWEKICVWFFYYFNFEWKYDVLKSKSPCILLNKITNVNKNETESKMQNPTHNFRETNLVLSSYRNRK